MVKEMRLVLRNMGVIDPLKIEDYIAAGGYQALKKVSGMSQLEVIEEVKNSGLRGRGGAGFNAGQKWFFAYSVQAAEKFVVCNADEGEPGTYKDRIIMESDPQSLLEGMAICGYAIGARRGFIYCRAEYPEVAEILKTAIAQAEEKGVLGDFSIEVVIGAGAYVCGEETALLESMEGQRGEPRYRPPYPPVAGFHQMPTIVNNVETFVNVPLIIEKGAEWFAGLGAKSYPGTKVMTLTGDVNKKTVIEVPTDVTVRQVIFELGGGIPNGKKFKAVQVGGTSGGIMPESLLDTPIDFDSLRHVGATHGSGAVFVIDETRDMVDVVTRIAKFFEEESCGKCAPCREGSMRLHQIMSKFNDQLGTAEELELLKKLGRVMAGSCLCGLGQAAPTPVVTAIEHFGMDFHAKMQ